MYKLADKYNINFAHSKIYPLYNAYFNKELDITQRFGSYKEVTEDTKFYDKLVTQREKGRTNFSEWDISQDGLDAGDWVIVNKPEQVHILGSKQDIQGFKEFVKTNSEITNLNNISDFDYSDTAFNIC